MYVFRWNAWNIDYIGKHSVAPADVEHVVNHGRRPWPEKIGRDKWRVWGQTLHGTYLQVIYVFDPEDVVFVIHAMPLSEAQKRQYRRRAR